MDQLKLLNFHKMIANFANNLVGAFVPLIIYQATGNLMYAIIYLVCNNVCRLLFEFAFKNLYGKYPQLFLLLRIIPITLYNVFIFVLDVNLVLGVIGVCLFLALDNSLNGLSKEIIYNYSSLTQKSDKSLGITRLFEQIGIIVALIVGGFLLDLNKTLVLIISLVIYAISVIPLVSFYIKSKNQKTFNKDATSNAINTLSKNSEYKKKSNKLTFKLLLCYAISYFTFAFYDMTTTTYSLFVFIQKGEFAVAGILNAVFNSMYAIGFFVAGIANEKRDLTKLVSIFSILIGALAITLPFVNLDKYFVLVCLIYGTLGFTYPFISLFVLDRMLIKSRIMGVSNKALYVREISCVSAYCVGYSCGFFGLIGIFASILVFMCTAGFIIPYCEEKTRQNLVNYLQNNEIIRQ